MSLGLYDKLLRRKICKSGWQESWQEASKSSWQQDKVPPPPSCQGDAKKNKTDNASTFLLAWRGAKKTERSPSCCWGSFFPFQNTWAFFRTEGWVGGGLRKDSGKKATPSQLAPDTCNFGAIWWHKKKARAATENKVVCKSRSAFSVRGKG